MDTGFRLPLASRSLTCWWCWSPRRDLPVAASERQLSADPDRISHSADAAPSTPAAHHLAALADAFGSADPAVRRELLVRSPSQGITRFQQHYSAADVMTEDRLLRSRVYVQVEQALGRRTTLGEQRSLSMGLDLMIQQAMLAERPTATGVPPRGRLSASRGCLLEKRRHRRQRGSSCQS